MTFLEAEAEDLDGGEYLFAFCMMMVLFQREFSFVDALYLWQLMWAMEYNPKIFSFYEKSSIAKGKSAPRELDDKLLQQYGNFERNNFKTGSSDYQSTLAVFLAASILEIKHKPILKEAKSVDDIVKILGDITDNLNAKKACKEALTFHQKFLKKTQQLQQLQSQLQPETQWVPRPSR